MEVINIMTVCKCDRCGKYYDKNEKVHKSGIFKYTPSGIVEVSTNEKYYNAKDLCDDCLEKLEKFLNGAELMEE